MSRADEEIRRGLESVLLRLPKMSSAYDGKSAQELLDRHVQLTAEKPWLEHQHYFKNCRMTRLALMKIVCHAHEGASNVVVMKGEDVAEEKTVPCEIIGMLLGYIADEAVSS
jgi:hypothetical protein